MTIKNKIEQLCHALLEKGNRLFGTKAVIHEIRWDLVGQAAGIAGIKNGVWYLRFNVAVLENHPSDMIQNTVPHEIAHLIVYSLKRQGRSHDAGHGRDFKRVCLALGGNALRCHSLDVEKARVHTKYEYKTDSGRTVKVGSAVHKKIQSGSVRLMSDTKERFNRTHYTGKTYKE